MSLAHKGKPSKKKGISRTAEEKAKIKKGTRLKTPRGKNHPNWKGGLTGINKTIRKSFQYMDWRNAVYARDNYTCQKCGDDKGGNLNAHHIKPFAIYEELRFDISNGITLCENCHDEEHSTKNKD